jgi:NADH-quinone oxidoreductase subunit C
MTTDGVNGTETSTDSLDGTIWPLVDGCLSGITCEPERGAQDLIVKIPKDELIRGLRALKDHAELSFDYLRCLSGVDWEDEGIDVVYHLYSSTSGENLTVKTRLTNDDLTVATATDIWRAANWLERETAEMFGVRFEGHPDPRALLLPDDMDDTFPLRKEHPLAEIEVLQGEGIAYGGGVQ